MPELCSGGEGFSPLRQAFTPTAQATPHRCHRMRLSSRIPTNPDTCAPFAPTLHRSVVEDTTTPHAPRPCNGSASHPAVHSCPVIEHSCAETPATARANCTSPRDHWARRYSLGEYTKRGRRGDLPSHHPLPVRPHQPSSYISATSIAQDSKPTSRRRPARAPLSICQALSTHNADTDCLTTARLAKRTN